MSVLRKWLDGESGYPLRAGWRETPPKEKKPRPARRDDRRKLNGFLRAYALCAIVLCMLLRPGLTRYVLERALIAEKKTMRILARFTLVQLLFLQMTTLQIIVQKRFAVRLFVLEKMFRKL